MDLTVSFAIDLIVRLFIGAIQVLAISVSSVVIP